MYVCDGGGGGAGRGASRGGGGGRQGKGVVVRVCAVVLCVQAWEGGRAEVLGACAGRGHVLGMCWACAGHVLGACAGRGSEGTAQCDGKYGGAHLRAWLAAACSGAAAQHVGC